MQCSVVNDMVHVARFSGPVIHYQHYMELAFVICHVQLLARIFEEFSLHIEGFLKALMS